MLRKLLLPFLFVAFFVFQAMAQTGSITGTVTNEEGEPVPTANVLLVEIGRGAATNLQGEYTIEDVPPGTYTLRVSFVGYETYEAQVTIEAGETLTKEVVLKQAAVGLNELIVTGYGVETKASLTGSVASVSVEEMEHVPVQNTGGLLQGRAAGVQVTSTSGSPGAGFEITIRGAGSINAGSRPLYIVDGVQLSFSNGSELLDQPPLNVIDPDNIESIEVLKDVAATAIYGAQGANGVVIITTKSGRTGPTKISTSISRGVTTPITPLDMMNSQQWLEWFTRAYMYTDNLSRDQAVNKVQFTLLEQYGYAPNTSYSEVRYTDWIDFIYKPGVTWEYNLSFSGGGDDTRFYIAGGYETVNGHIKDSDFTRYSLRTNVTHDVNSNFSLGVNLGITQSLFTGICQDGDFIGCPVSGALFEVPISYPYLESGAYNPNVRFGLPNNLAVVFNETERISEVFHMIGNISANYDFTSWLNLEVKFGLDYRNIRNKAFFTPVAEPSEGGDINTNVEYVNSFNTSAVLNFRQTFDLHNFSGLLGVEYRRDFTREIEASGIGLPGGTFDVLSATAEPEGVGGFEDAFRIAGYFLNLKYNYDQRYIISATARYDGSSRFGAENRWGFFPAVSAAWRISEEDFFTVDFVESLKLRASYGVAGNSLIGLYAARGLYGVTGTYATVTGLAPIQLANRRLTWEESVQKNIGLDFVLFSGRISGTINVYQKNNVGLLLAVPLPASSSFQSIIQNIGEIRNRGVEVALHTVNINTDNFIWSTNFNVALAQNEVVRLAEGVQMLFPNSQLPIAVGHSINAIRRVRWAGVNPVDGRPMWYDGNGNITYRPKFASDAKFGDGGEEDVVGGFGNTFSYKGLSLNIFFQFSFGKTAMPNTAWDLANTQIGAIATNGLVMALTRSWQNPGDVVWIPAPQIGITTYPGTDQYSRSLGAYTSAAFFDASYIRLKSIRLSYSLPASVIGSLNIDDLSLFVAGSNLYTWTSYIGFDPEQAVVVGHSSYPAGRTVNAGIDIQF